MANASNVFRVGGECDHTRTSGNFSLKYVNFPPRKIVSDGAFVLEFWMLHVLCVPQLGSNSISVMKVRDFFMRGRLRYFARLPGGWTKAPYGVRVLSGTSLLSFFTRKPEGSLAQLGSCNRQIKGCMKEIDFIGEGRKENRKTFRIVISCLLISCARLPAWRLSCVFVTMCVFSVAERVLDEIREFYTT